MKFAGIKELKHNTMEIIKNSEQGDVVITAYGKPAAILHHVTEDDFADYLVENDPAFNVRIREAYAEYKISGGISIDAMIKKLEKRRGKRKI